MAKAAKFNAALISGAVVTVAVWVANAFAHIAIPDFVQGALTTIVTAIVVYAVPNSET